MINISYRPPKEIVVEGHSGKQGESLICCSVSTTMNLLGFGLIENKIDNKQEYRSGYHKITIGDSEVGKISMNTVAKYLDELATEFPEDITFRLEQ